MRLATADRDRVVPMYESGQSSVAIAHQFGVSATAILGLLARRGIERRPQHRYEVNEHYFDDLNAEGPAYWLGFLFADGAVIERKYGPGFLSINLGRKDESHIEKFRDDLSSTHPIKRRIDTGTSYIYIKRAHLVSTLRTHGCIPRKTYHLEFPNHIPDGMLHHFMRGFFDGDGSVYFSGGHPHFKVSGLEMFIGPYQEILMARCGVKHTKLEQDKYSPSSVSVRYGGVRNLKAIFGFLYSGATVFLDRKEHLVRSIERS